MGAPDLLSAQPHCTCVSDEYVRFFYHMKADNIPYIVRNAETMQQHFFMSSMWKSKDKYWYDKVQEDKVIKT